ncbi:MAG TPA: DUF4397 domain-containing protein [Gemmatimonadaceae bacterium]
MRLHRYFVIGLLAAAAAACGGDQNGVTQPAPQLAYVRYVNAINDTKNVAFRVVDGIQYSPSYFGDKMNGAHFREISPYQGMGPGSRHITVFWDDTLTQNASTVVADQTIDFTAGTYYTVVLTGSSVGANTGTLTVYTDDMSGVASDKILVRAYNLAPALGNVDILTDTTAATVLIGGVAPGTASAPVTIPVATGSMYFAAAASGTATPTYAAAAGPMGKNDPVVQSAGLSVGGSDVTVLLMPAGGAFANPGIVFASHYRPADATQ